MVFENIKIFEYYASVIALELGDNGIWYGSLCTFKYVPANVQVALNCYLNKNTYLEFNVVIVGHKKVPYSVNPFLS